MSVQRYPGEDVIQAQNRSEVSSKENATTTPVSTTEKPRYVPPHMRNRVLTSVINQDVSPKQRSWADEVPERTERRHGTPEQDFSSQHRDSADRPSWFSRSHQQFGGEDRGERRYATPQSFGDRDGGRFDDFRRPGRSSPAFVRDRGDPYGSRKTFNGRIDETDREIEELFSHVKTGINFDKYDDIHVEIKGENAPRAIDAFDDLTGEFAIAPNVLENVRRAGYSKPTPIQKNSIPIVMTGHDLMACAQTGSGKTAAFLLPLMSRMLQEGPPETPPTRPGSRRKAYPMLLVLAPTRELACQIFDEARKFGYRTGLRPCVAYGGAPIIEQLKELERGCDVLVATPGRLVDMLERGRVSLQFAKYLCLDEADRMLDMGFEPQIRRIVEQEDMPPTKDRQTVMFSATFPKEIQHLARDFHNKYIMVTIGRLGSTNEYISQRIEQVSDNDKREYVVDLLQGVPGLTLIFVETKRGADALEDFLIRQGIQATSIHGDRSQAEREDALWSFKTGRTPVLVATDVAARGLDIPNVAHVINFDLPSDINDYVHRIGRTGRAGQSGVATAFYNEKNRNLAKDLVGTLRDSGQSIPEFLELAMMSRASGYDSPAFRRIGGGRGGRGTPTGRSTPKSSGWGSPAPIRRSDTPKYDEVWDS